ncbi:hypothetical protein ALC57_00530 [Trachymyrmex cornetzi]|uniref:Uncharacterized protein n=1 Tax=Trachymyrmex cornetzi TaxID=471704 RepID=A0A151JS41_9HYME|nr:hypothetical protein ALC57_00530 [Trachymyrmex cornetzi]
MSRAARPCDSFNQSLGCVLLGPELTTSDHATKPYAMEDINSCNRPREEAPPEFADEWKRGT